MKFYRTLSATFLAAMTLGLASCEVEMDLASADRDEVILNNAAIFANKLGDLYDDVVTSGDSNSERILNNILFLYAKSYFGDFYEDYEADGTLKAGVKPSAFVGENDVVDAAKAKDFYNSIKTSVLKSFWTAVNNSTYQKNKEFDEKLFVKAQQGDLYSFPETATYAKKLVRGEHTYQDVLSFFHVSEFGAFRDYYKDYIARALLPNAYRKALVEQYLIDTNYGTLGRSYARKVEYVALPNLDKFEDSTRSLVRSYCKLVLSKANSVLGEKAATYKKLDFLDKLYQGIVEDPVEKAFADTIYADAGFNPIAVETPNGVVNSYRETTYGQLLDDYSKINTSRWEEGTSTDFTNSGAYSAATGLDMKTRDILAASKVTRGWYTSSGLSDLPSTMKTRLFKTQVANEVDDPKYETKPADETVKANFTWRVQGEYYLRPETFQSGEEYPYAMYDDSSKTWYIVRIDEAVKATKLVQDVEDSDSSYAKRPSDGSQGETLNQIVWNVADLIADGDSYKKAARQHYVEAMSMDFHDDDIYSYFETTFPDLFD